MDSISNRFFNPINADSVMGIFNEASQKLVARISIYLERNNKVMQFREE